MEATPDWSEIATRNPGIAGNSAETAVRSLEMAVGAGRRQATNRKSAGYDHFASNLSAPEPAAFTPPANVTSRACA